MQVDFVPSKNLAEASDTDCISLIELGYAAVSFTTTRKRLGKKGSVKINQQHVPTCVYMCCSVV